LPLDSGEVKTHHELFVLLNKIYAARRTGQLQLVLGPVERQLFFNGGQLVFASSSDRFDSLGEMMIREGAITQAQFEEASELMKTGQRFGSAPAKRQGHGTPRGPGSQKTGREIGLFAVFQEQEVARSPDQESSKKTFLRGLKALLITKHLVGA